MIQQQKSDCNRIVTGMGVYKLQGIYVDMNMIDKISSITGKLENRKGREGGRE